ncbi:bifunctional 2-C-methyl-D-erythritol 4-phosphate cytidylyltransferase/2-C-methyl-D-erythritol 2,4-cyclodiphosphate synthase [Massiliimalia massiliensis]|jgi:2-C-methyl-D-erythritol 4-phosphate cytidylyltransferase/2-C-methyl-D-erythritol 2,4-cyclodiphosphate synthase|uniref:bifunctional 2-C-methyl-D-erythritol 4-phosphate cytidylyltransferase/2-C-methyl-D-erythritol 2,4-cyclodiphosphate synthase n=1 Tax=Massiliimalia massiliensis TaxID=1852384 RepID=UPI0009875FD1|nr:bifunctional 2-C-methyl-D-erythritol 4-phosphate cytidylyltransferase/2-C-methyl-D-erythritol 2,4-cyclodiphosphate synthase [Massiliimalia massiliensis]
MLRVSVIIVAAGNAARMGGVRKPFLQLGGIPVIEHSVRTFYKIGQVREIIVVARKDEIPRMKFALREYNRMIPLKIVAGGETRQESVANGILVCDAGSTHLAIHDAARPLLEEKDVLKVFQDAKKYRAATLGVMTKDTVKVVREGWICDTPERSELFLTQTPQVFEHALYLKGMVYAKEHRLDFTDDCQLMEAIGVPVYMTQGSYSNIKLTTPEDLAVAQALLAEREGKWSQVRIGHGYDVHRLVEGRKLILGGVEISHTVGLLGHSDADVLVHAVMDALLGAAALGDIGTHFPDSDPAYAGADSLKLLEYVCALLAKKGYRIGNIDATVIAQKPKLAAFIPDMRKNIAIACKVGIEAVNIKATTEEKLGFTGEERGISAHAVALLEPSR